MNDQVNNRILVIDDNAAIHEDFKKILVTSVADTDLADAESMLFGESNTQLTKFSFHVDSAFQGQEGLELVEKSLAEGRPYAMAFVDVRMPPGWDGIETISRIWKIYPQLQVVLCTVYSDYSWEEVTGILKNLDSLLILKKPFDNIEVLQLAHALTNKWVVSKQAHSKMEDLDTIVQDRTKELRAANEKLEVEIRERRQAETDLRLSEERFSTAFEASPIPMAILTVDEHRIEDVNDSFLNMTGFDREETIGHTLTDLQFWINNSIPERLAEFKNAHRPVRNQECPIRTKNGERRETLAWVARFIFGQEPHLLMITQDISDLINLENQLRHSQKMEAVGQLAAGIAHDFNNLLTVIQGHTSLRLAAPDIESSLGEALRQIQAAADRASALTRQLLAFSRKQIMQPRPLCLNRLIGHLAKMLQRLIGEHIDVESELSENLPSINADACNIEQVILNLAVNARDAMPQGGHLVVRTEKIDVGTTFIDNNPEAHEGSYVCLTISDEGCGMDTTVRRRVFEPFFTTKAVGQGSGMGLATVYGIVKQHRGWIEMDSAVSRGTTFRVYLPTTDQKPVSVEEKPVIETPGGGQETILLVEDEVVLRELVQTVLSAQGYNVLTAERGEEALRIFNQHPAQIDLVFTDMVMPGGMTGRELAEQLNKLNPEIKIAFSSGYSQEMMGDNFVEREGAHFLAKPYRPPELIRLVRKILDASPNCTKSSQPESPESIAA